MHFPADAAGFRRVLHGPGEEMGGPGRGRAAVRGGRVARDAEPDGGCHLSRRVWQQLPGRQEDLPASGGAGQARRSGHAEASHPWILVSTES